MKNLLIISLTVTLLTSCATAPQFSTPPTKTSVASSGEMAQSVRQVNAPQSLINYLETIKFIQADSKIELNSSRVPLNGLYTKIMIKNKLPSIATCYDLDTCQSDDYLEYEKRGTISRFFLPKRVSLSSYVKLDTSAYQTTIPLLAIDETSSSEVGSSWDRSKVYSHETEPLFLVPTNISRAKLMYSFSGNEENKLNSAKVLDVAIGAINILSPSSSLLTSLNKQSISDKSKAIDSAIANAFSESILETIELSLRLDSWSGKDVYLLTMKLPKDKTDWESKLDNLSTVGQWVIKFEAPKISVFYPYHLCGKEPGDADGISSEYCFNSYTDAEKSVYKEFKKNEDYYRVLDTSLYQLNDSQKVTISNIISEIPSVQRLADSDYSSSFKKNDTTKIQDINIACSDIARKVTSLGLSVVDTNLITYATFLSSSLIKVNAYDWENNLNKMKACEILGKKIVNTTI